MYLKRKIDRFLLEWKNNKEKKPLVIKGPRQVGKTQSILKFTKENYQKIIYINFIEEPIYKAVLESGYNEQFYTFPYFLSFLIKDYIKTISKIT
ncbi:MAG: AAA family ATPase [Acholeplasmataceae bacterium]|nr:AAA family ATPase [Acholeplasmataceae bacterium]